MKLHKYADYNEYVREQNKGNKSSLGRVWALEKNIAIICAALHGAKFGICHGTRTGEEQRYFKKYLPGCGIIGTEIADNAERYPNTIKHDFTKPHPLLCDADFVYSNAIDHAYDPATTIKTWAAQLKRGGRLVVEHSSQHARVSTARDPFAASLEEFIGLVTQWAPGLLHINTIQIEKTKDTLLYSAMIIFRKD